MKQTLTILTLLFTSFFGTAQSNLEVRCYQTPNSTYLNQILIDNTLIEYDLCGLTPSFYVSIIDTACTAWGTKISSTNSNMNHDFGNANNDLGCRQRVEYYFVYRQDNYSDLVSMDSLLNYWIPTGHTIAIWTPIAYNHSTIDSLYPTLGNTLVNKWGATIQTASMMVLFGVQGQPSSFTIDTLTSGDSIFVSKTICSNPSLGIADKIIQNKRSLVKVVDLMGREVEEAFNVWQIHIYDDGTRLKVFKIE